MKLRGRGVKFNVVSSLGQFVVKILVLKSQKFGFLVVQVKISSFWSQNLSKF